MRSRFTPILAFLLLLFAGIAPVAAQNTPIDWHVAIVGDATSIERPDACPGCCSGHGGISSTCGSNGRIVCRDGTVSPSCSCSSCGVSQTPTCTGGRYWNGSACVCPTGQSFTDGQCRVPTPTCTGGQIWNGTACACPAGQSLVSGQCRSTTPTCTGGQIWNGTACACPAGQTLTNDQCAATTAFAIGPWASGNWFNASESGHGFQFEVLGEPPSVMTVFWFTFDNAGNAAWISGAGTFQGNRFVVDAARRLGGRFPPNFNGTSVTTLPWGRLTFTFLDCSHARVEWSSSDPNFTANGAMNLEPLTRVSGLRCP